jgi:hypothetical protein
MKKKIDVNQAPTHKNVVEDGKDRWKSVRMNIFQRNNSNEPTNGEHGLEEYREPAINNFSVKSDKIT